jgi:hypothetical protein
MALNAFSTAESRLLCDESMRTTFVPWAQKYAAPSVPNAPPPPVMTIFFPANRSSFRVAGEHTAAFDLVEDHPIARTLAAARIETREAISMHFNFD